MKAHELTKSTCKFRLAKGRVVWQKAHMNGDRRTVCISRTDKQGYHKMYIKPHTEVVVVV